MSGKHWAITLLGSPWQAGGRGPDAYDCWGLFQAVQREHYGREVKPLDVDAGNTLAVAKAIRDHSKAINWQPTNEPKDGDAVLLSQGNYPTHVGIWLDVDGGGVLHCQRGPGVIFTRKADLPSGGWARIEYYAEAE